MNPAPTSNSEPTLSGVRAAPLRERRRLPRVHDFLDYREYLRAYFDAKKAMNPHFSHRVFAREAGLGSQSYLSMVIERKRNLSMRSLPKFIDGLKLAGRERSDFETLVRYDQCDDLEEKSRLFSELLKQRSNRSELFDLERERFEFLSQWHAVAIYVLVGLQGFQYDPEWISRALGRKITSAQAREALSLLSRLGLIVESEGVWRQVLGAITVKDNTRAMAVARYHEAHLRLAFEALKKLPIEQREMAGATISIPASHLDELKEKIRAFRRELNTWSSSFQDSNQVFQVNLQLFPLSEQITGQTAGQTTSQTADPNPMPEDLP